MEVENARLLLLIKLYLWYNNYHKGAIVYAKY